MYNHAVMDTSQTEIGTYRRDTPFPGILYRKPTDLTALWAKVGAALKISLKAGIASHRALQGVAQLLHDLEQREATVRRLTGRGRRVPAAARQQGNVITGAFAAAGD